MEHSNRDKINQKDDGKIDEKVKPAKPSKNDKPKGDSSVSFGEKGGRSEDLNEPSRRSGQSGSSGMGSSSGRSSGSSGIDSGSKRTGKSIDLDKRRDNESDSSSVDDSEKGRSSRP